MVPRWKTLEQVYLKSDLARDSSKPCSQGFAFFLGWDAERQLGLCGEAVYLEALLFYEDFPRHKTLESMV
jgi:hypothetical protein